MFSIIVWDEGFSVAAVNSPICEVFSLFACVFCLCLSLSLFLSVLLSLSMPVPASLSLSLPLCPSVSLHACPCLSLSLFLSVLLSLSMPVPASLSLSLSPHGFSRRSFGGFLAFGVSFSSPSFSVVHFSFFLLLLLVVCSQEICWLKASRGVVV